MASNGIVHLGVGNFHRAHQAVFTDALLRRGGEENTQWGVCGVGLRAPDAPLFKALLDQGCKYTVWERGTGVDRVRQVECHKALLLCPNEPDKVMEAMTSEVTKVITLTVTEKGYCLTPAGTLDLELPAVQSDLGAIKDGTAAAGKAVLQTAPGLIVAALSARSAGHGKGLTVLSCDNLQENGHRVREAVLSLAKAVSETLSSWIQENVSFPNSMVDRITPAPTPESIKNLKEAHGIDDVCSLVCEDFLLWVVEDDFKCGRPKWEEVAAELQGQCLIVKDVVPYELMKLRVLNGGHQAVAYVGLMMGYRFVHEALEDPAVRGYLLAYMTAAARTLLPVPGVDVAEWSQQTLRRFQNSAVKDTLLRLAEDSVNRIEVAVMPQLEPSAAEGGVEAISVLLAAWAKYVCRGEDEKGATFTRLPDARGVELKSLAEAAVSKSREAGAVMALLNAAFPGKSAALAPLEAAVTAALDASVADSVAAWK
eukprot:TRINITY_DN32654_c0_g1_i1.p1 TRINITY_DN32654_c0_g1~~TRINITY_DN32654_c0_g1_i1.p1  ORF type:complete len:501 (+),score=113.22 TRINITY_DN32654_c0_g1_i1:60-1505(+)